MGNQMYSADGNALFDKANIDIVNEEIESLQEQTADIELQTVTPDEIEKADLTPFDIINIGFLLEDEDVYKNVPEAADFNDDGEVETWNINKLFPRAVWVLQEHDNRIEELEKENESLKNRIDELENSLS